MNLSKDCADIRGEIFNFQRYCIHDGPGIRSVVFLYGCPLRCIWCCNPEAFTPNVLYMRETSVAQAIDWLMEDLIYFRKSGGGITLSGGEPLLQIEFVKALLENCREYNIGTAVETCGDVPWSSFKMIDGLVDFYLYDIKHMDDNYHKRYTGAGNKRILENLKRLSKCDKTIFLRLPLIDCFNLDEEEAHMIGKLTGELNIAEVHLLPYHRLGEKKYAQLSIPYLLQGEKDVMSKQTGRKRVERFAEIIRLYNKNVHVGG